MSALVSTEIQAHQQINNAVRHLTSSKQKLKIIQVVTAIGYIFAFFSIGGSGYGIYYDMLLDYGFFVALGVGALGGLVIEAGKMIGVWLFFAYEQLHIKLIGFALLSLFTAFAIQLHFIGATNMEVTKRVQVLQDIYNKNYSLQQQREARNNKVVQMMDGVLNNGTSVDDKLATRTIRDLDKTANEMKMSELDRMLYQETKDGARKRGNSMRKLLPLFEIFSIFGLLGAYLKTQSVNGDVKETIKRVDNHIENESTIVYATNAVQNEVSPTVAHVEKILSQNRTVVSTEPNIPTDLTPEQRAEIMKILLTKNNTQATQPAPKAVQEQTAPPPTKKEETVYLADRFSKSQEPKEVEAECVEEEIEAEPIYVTVENERVRALDYRLYNKEEREALKVMFDNGDIMPGEYLVKRTAIVAELKKKYKNIGEVLLNLNGKLLDKGYIKQGPRGYIAQSVLPKEGWQDIES